MTHQSARPQVVFTKSTWLAFLLGWSKHEALCKPILEKRVLLPEEIRNSVVAELLMTRDDDPEQFIQTMLAASTLVTLTLSMARTACADPNIASDSDRIALAVAKARRTVAIRYDDDGDVVMLEPSATLVHESVL